LKNLVRTFIILFIIFFLPGFLVTNYIQSDNSSKNSNEEHKKNELVLAIGGEPDGGFDPTTGWGRYGSPLFQSTLLKRDHEFNVINDLANGYSLSKNGEVWTVKLRENVQFSDGKPLTAKDVVFTFNTAKQSGSVVDLSNLEKVEEIAPYTVQFTLHKPQSTFIQNLITTGIIPMHAYGEDYQENPIGSGPYKLVQWNKGQQLIVEKNPYYYGSQSRFNRLTFVFLSPDAAFAAAKAGQVDIVSIPPTLARQKVEGMKVRSLKSIDNRGVMFPFIKEEWTKDQNIKVGNDVTADLAIRHAINIAIDRQALVNGVLDGYGSKAFSVSDGLPWWNLETVIEDGNHEQAIQLLKKAGWSKGDDGYLARNGLKASFTLLYPADDQIRQSLSIAFAEMLKPIGIEVKVEGKSWDEIQRRMHSTPVMMGWGSHDPLELYNLYSSKTTGAGWFNSNYYSNPTVDQYLEKALRATNLAEANEYWKKAQWDGNTGFSTRGDAPWAWLVNLDHVYLVREELEIGKQKIQPHGGHGWPIMDSIAQWKWIE
jgi:peptide/nickel transport system substrate-binding protein